MTSEAISAAFHLLTLAFGAGGAWFLIGQARKDVNGLGRKVNRDSAKAAARHQNVSVALMLIAPETQREKIAELLRESGEE